MEKDIDNMIGRFEPVSLADTTRKAALLDRSDTKYVFAEEQLIQVLDCCRSIYKILDINDKRSFRYNTIYFDTLEMRFYHDHHSGKRDRKKIRIRKYLDSGVAYLEVKHRHNKGNTVKTRLMLAEGGPNDVHALTNPTFREAGDLPIQQLKPVLSIDYHRITLVDTTRGERVTIDRSLIFTKEDVCRELRGLVVAEVKQCGRQASPFRQLMREMGIREGSVSKYCLGTLLLNNHVKRNRFKRKLKKMLKLSESTNKPSHV